jgi:hypothetical protein
LRRSTCTSELSSPLSRDKIVRLIPDILYTPAKIPAYYFKLSAHFLPLTRPSDEKTARYAANHNEFRTLMLASAGTSTMLSGSHCTRSVLFPPPRKFLTIRFISANPTRCPFTVASMSGAKVAAIAWEDSSLLADSKTALMWLVDHSANVERGVCTMPSLLGPEAGGIVMDNSMEI